jgi:hypothetical protein
VSALDDLREWWDREDDWPPSALYDAAIVEVLAEAARAKRPLAEVDAYHAVHDLAQEWRLGAAQRRAAAAREIATGVPSTILSPKQRRVIPEIRKVVAEIHRSPGAVARLSVVADRVGVSRTTLRAWITLGLVSLERPTGQI